MWRLLIAAGMLAGCTMHDTLPPAVPNEQVVFQPPPPSIVPQDASKSSRLRSGWLTSQ